MCFLSTTFPNALAHPPPILFDQSLTQHEIIMRILSRLLFLNYASQELQPNLCNIKPSPKGTDFSNHFFGGEGCGLI